MKYLPFSEAREYIHKLHLSSRSEWRTYCKSGNRPGNIPSNPVQTYDAEWKSWGDWLGTGKVAVFNMKFRSFNEARKYVRNLGLKSGNDWRAYIKSRKKPTDIPSNPDSYYKKEWKSWGDWLGTGTIANKRKNFLPFEEARQVAHNLKLKNQYDWRYYIRSGKKPSNLPTRPDQAYKEIWKGWGDWLGTGNIATQERKYFSFLDARTAVHSLKLKSREQWKRYYKTNKVRDEIPLRPDAVYQTQWKGWGDWLGTGSIANQSRKFMPFEDARRHVHQLGLKSFSKWRTYYKSGRKPNEIPANPIKTYKDKWISWGDWLGTGTVAPQNREFVNFAEASKFAQQLKLNNIAEWDAFCKSGKKPYDIPSFPRGVYKDEWKGWGHWLGTGNINPIKWPVHKVKELLQDLIKSKVIYEWDEAVLYSFLLRKGLLSLDENRHAQFFKNLISAARTDRGKKIIEEYANSNSENPPDLTVITNKRNTVDEIQTLSEGELSRIDVENPLDYQKDWSVEQILIHTDALESINVDEEAMQFYVDYSVDELWKLAFEKEHGTVKKLKWVGKSGNKYHDMVIDIFLADYEGSTKLNIPSDYSFPYAPTLMQRYVAYKISKLPHFGNFSGTGAGKTLSAILASRIIDSKITIIVCPNDVVEQWRRNILDTFPNSKVITGKDAFNIQYSKEYQYAILNYDKFSQEDSPNLILNLAKQKIDFVILDEIHFTKIRNEEEVSQRRRNLDGLMTGIRKINPSVKVLGLSATPVVNNLREGRSLLELISGKVYEDVAVRPTIPNAVTLYDIRATILIIH